MRRWNKCKTAIGSKLPIQFCKGTAHTGEEISDVSGSEESDSRVSGHWSGKMQPSHQECLKAEVLSIGGEHTVRVDGWHAGSAAECGQRSGCKGPGLCNAP